MKPVLRSGCETIRLCHVLFLCALFCRQPRVLIAPWGAWEKPCLRHTPIGCATPPDQSPTEALLGASGKRLSSLLKERFAYTGRQLRPEGDELLEIGIDCAQFCAACVVFCVALWDGRLFSRGLLQLLKFCLTSQSS